MNTPDPPKIKKPPGPPPSFGDPGIWNIGKWLRMRARNSGIAGTIGFGRDVARGYSLRTAIRSDGAPSNVTTKVPIKPISTASLKLNP